MMQVVTLSGVVHKRLSANVIASMETNKNAVTLFCYNFIVLSKRNAENLIFKSRIGRLY